MGSVPYGYGWLWGVAMGSVAMGSVGSVAMGSDHAIYLIIRELS